MLQQIHDTLFDAHQLKVYVYRLDLIHPQVSGNKGYKLKYNLQEARKQKKNTLLTFGGAYSNHIYATAAAGKEGDFKTIGVIRGEEHLPLNPTLKFATEAGMHLHYMDRTTYRNKKSAEVLDKLRHDLGDFYLIPEGGSNALAVKGCTEILPEISIDFDVVTTACGTGGTLAGLVAHLEPNKQVLGFPALKGGDFLYQDIAQLLDDYYALEGLPDTRQPYKLMTDYHFGGYAKKKPALEQFIVDFEQKHPIPIEWIYTGKMFYGLYNLISKGFFEAGTTIVALHTGGLR